MCSERFFYFGTVVYMWQLQRCTFAGKKMPTVDWIRGKVGCTSVPIVRLLFTLVTRLMCDREALNSLIRVFVFSCVLACQIRVAREFKEVINKKHARVMRASVKLKLSGTVCKHTVHTYICSYVSTK